MENPYPALAANLTSWIHSGILQSIDSIELLDGCLWIQTHDSCPSDTAVVFDVAHQPELDWIQAKPNKPFELIVSAMGLSGKKTLRQAGALRKENLIGMFRPAAAFSLNSELTFVPFECSAPAQLTESAPWLGTELSPEQLIDLHAQIQARAADPACQQYWIYTNNPLLGKPNAVRSAPNQSIAVDTFAETSPIGTVSLHNQRGSKLTKAIKSSGWTFESSFNTSSLGIYDLYIDEPYRAKQIGSAVLNWSVGQAAELGIESVLVFADPKLQTFYERSGFQVVEPFERWMVC